jgi:hypothetical protein
MCNDQSIITDPRQATPEWLTHVLRQSGVLHVGEVTRVHAITVTTYTSTVARLTLVFSDGAPPNTPAHLFLKLSRPDSQQRVVGSEQRRQEVEFHNRVAAMMPHPPLVRCYHATYCEATGASHLLFDDVSATHFGGTSSTPPGKLHCDTVMDAFAAFHAFWWDHPALPTVSVPRTQASVARDIANIRDCYPGFADFTGERLAAPQRRLYERAIDALPRLMQRVTRKEHLTLIHGDANLSNVMLPCDHRTGGALIIDWQLWGVSFAAEDLAHLIALHWPKSERDAMEHDLLRRYHAGLLRHGVRHYAWADCWYDYRLAGIIRVLFMPMWFWNSGAPADSVWSSLANAMQVYADLECGELL